MSDILLETHALTKQFRKHKAVDEINMHIKRGGIYGFIGRNGAGKTTFLKMISGLTTPSSGDYSLFGYSGKELSKVRSRVGCLIEEPGLYINMSAYDNLMIKAKLFGISDKKYVSELLDMVGLADVGKKKTKNFSLGMKQRLGIALAMVGNPDFLVLDEPINGLDPVGIVEIRNLLKQINQRFGVTILISSHILTELHELATDYIMIDRGQIIDCLSATQLDAKCHRILRLRTNDVKKILDILAMRYNIVNVYVNGDEIIVDQPVNSDELAWVLYNERVFVSEYHLEEESLENYFIHRIGGAHYA